MTNDSCAKCQKPVEADELVVQCIGCRKQKHAECAKISAEEAGKKRWRCRNCKKSSTKYQTQETKEGYKRSIKSKTIIENKQYSSRQRVDAHDFDKLKVQCYDGHSKLKSLERRMKNLIDKYDDVLNQNQKLEKQLSTYKLKVEDLEQKIRENAVEVWGIPVAKSDNLMDIFRGICDAMDLKSYKHQVERIWREKKNENEFLVGTLIGKMDASVPRTVICINFVTRYYKDEFMEAWKSIEQAEGVTLRQLGIDSEGRIKIENSLTSYKQQLFLKAWEYANDNHYPRVGIKDGEVYIIKNLENGPMIFIKTPKDFEKLADIERRL